MNILRSKAWAPYTFIGAWAVALNLIVGALMVGHWVTLPHPVVGSQLPISNLQSAVWPQENGDNRLQVYHVLLGSCPCSQRILRHLSLRQPLAQCQETVLLVEDPGDRRVPEEILQYRVERMTMSQLNCQFGVESAPMMLVVNHDNHVVYAGGYTSRKQGLEIRDVAIIESLIAGDSVMALPVYGCAASQRLQQMLDPLGLKY